MYRNGIINLLVALFLPVSLQAQGPVGLRPSVHDPWLSSSNAAALTRYSHTNIGMAALSLTKSKGGFVDFAQSPDALSVDASVESFFRLNSRAVVYGAMSYAHSSGHDMAGSAFIQSPASPHLPFDIVEDSLTNTGTKHQDTYRLTSGMGYDIVNGLSLGVRLDYTAANLAKYKDLRHKNKLMDLDLTAGLYYPLTVAGRVTLGLGANYLYHRTTESVQFSTYGKNDKVYNSLISYANFTGHLEQFGSDGYTDKSREMPLVSDYNGLGVQLSVTPPTAAAEAQAATPRQSFYNSFTYAHRRGYYGRRSPYTVTYTGHESECYRYDARLSLAQSHSRVYLDLSLTAENLRNDAANYRSLQNEHDATYYEYYTAVKTANKLWTDGSASVTAELGRLDAFPSADKELQPPVWSFRAGLSWHHREQTAYVYPFYRSQDIRSLAPSVSVCRSIPATRARHSSTPAMAPFWTLALDFAFLKGSGQPFEDSTFQEPSDKQQPPPTMDAYLWREYQWLTAAQYHLGGSVAYSFIMPRTGVRTFLRLSIAHRKANETTDHSMGCDNTSISAALGCTF